MTIPSELLVEDIKKYETYHKKPYQNGEGIFIGYGHNLWHDPSPILGADEDLIYAINHYGYEQREELSKRIMEIATPIEKAQAEELLHKDLLRHLDMLTEYSSGFRRVLNGCKYGFFHKNSPLFQKITNMHGNTTILQLPEQIQYDPTMPDMQSNRYATQELIKKGRKKLLKNLQPEEYQPHDKAMVRIDALIHLSYLMGGERLIRWKAVLAPILLDKFDDAADAMLNSAFSKEIGKRVSMLSRRIRYGIWEK